MASQGVTPTSRLAQMQIRFQQKQLQEREQKRLEMSAESSTNDMTTAKNIGKGKVREMFDRRRVAGIDRSNPLKPIATASVSNSQNTLNNNNQTPLAGQRRPAALANGRQVVPPRQSVPRQTNVRPTLPRNVSDFKAQAMHSGNAVPRPQPFAHNYDDLDSLDNETFPKQFTSLSLGGDNPRRVSDRNNNNSNTTTTKSSGFSRGRSSDSFNRIGTQKSLPSKSRQWQDNRDSAIAHSNVKPPIRIKERKLSSQQKMDAKPLPDGMGTCKYCGRHFILDRLGKHEQVCQKMSNHKRKVFDTTKQRIQGTDAANYLKKNPSRANGATAKQTAGVSTGPKKSNWRSKHEEFIAAIRAAKEVKAHLARGGNLRDLPPPPPSENPDYIQCPHCLRRFNEAAAERHIPKCATMLHNKPKPGQGAIGKKR